MVSLKINGVLRTCLIDTGGSYSLIRQSLVEPTEMYSEDMQSLCLRGITGHEIRLHGTTKSNIETETGGVGTSFELIVCDDKMLKDVEVLLGRDFFAQQEAEISYKREPSLLLWGQKILMRSTREVMEMMSVQDDKVIKNED